MKKFSPVILSVYYLHCERLRLLRGIYPLISRIAKRVMHLSAYISNINWRAKMAVSRAWLNAVVLNARTYIANSKRLDYLLVSVTITNGVRFVLDGRTVYPRSYRLRS